MRAKNVLLTAWFFGGASGCVPLPPEAMPKTQSSITQRAFQDLDPGAKTLASLHFEIRAYSSPKAQEISEFAERLYERIMMDTGLYSFMPTGLYFIVVYANQQEFLQKTGMPSWSGGVAQGNAIYSYEGSGLAGVLAHEMTHLIFHEAMGPRVEHRWLNEGLAVYEEKQVSPSPIRIGKPIPFDHMMRLAPIGESERMVGEWYAQVASVVGFLIERGGRVGFSQFLKALREGRSVDDALRIGFPGLWGSLAELEAAWQKSL